MIHYSDDAFHVTPFAIFHCYVATFFSRFIFATLWYFLFIDADDFADWYFHDAFDLFMILPFILFRFRIRFSFADREPDMP